MKKEDKENIVSTKTLAELAKSNLEIIGGIHREKAIKIWKPDFEEK